MRTFEITVQRAAGDGWPVVAEYNVGGAMLPQRAEARLSLDRAALMASRLDPLVYGTLLGQALFREAVRDLFSLASAELEDPLRVLLSVEAPELRTEHWERLCAPRDGRWDFLALDHQRPLSLYLPSLTDRRFPPIGRRDLRVLLLVASPMHLADYDLAPFDVAATVASLRAALAPLPCDVLASLADAVGPPTVDALCERLTASPYTMVHIVSHGRLLPEQTETILFLADDQGQVAPVVGTRLLERLSRLRGARGLPYLTFLATCESANPAAEAGLGGLGQRLVRELGMPAVVAMTAPVGLATAADLARVFYRQLQAHGEVDRALAEATAGMADRADVTVPALFSRLGGRPLFSDTIDRPLTAAEIIHGLARLRALVAERAPILTDEAEALSATLAALLAAPVGTGSGASRHERAEALQAVAALCDRVIELPFAALALGAEPAPYDARSPFRGLYPFRAEDREFFFGREALVERLRQRLVDESFLAVLGRSGSGKSSLVLAGLAPALQEAGHDLHVMTPGSEPLAQLEKLLADAGDAPWIVIDQFEEIFTLVRDDEARQAFLDRLLGLTPTGRVVVTMRVDFLGQCTRFPVLWTELQAHQAVVEPLSIEALRDVIERQARTVGLRFEADLSRTILDDIHSEPGAMPLLQHALLELWRRRHGRWLVTAEYRTIGGVQQAIAHTAEGLYSELSGGERDRMRDIFVRLTRLDDDETADSDGERQRRDTRRRASLSELVPAGNDETSTRHLVARLATARLLVTSHSSVTDQDEVTMAHEALLRYWPRLRQWLDEDRASLRAREQLRDAAQEWAASSRDDSFLVHRGQRLRLADALAQHPRTGLNALEMAYVNAAVALQQREQATELEQARRLTEAETQARQEAERRVRIEAAARASLRKRAIILRVVALTAIVSALAAGWAWRSAEDQRQQTDTQRRIARSRGLAASALAELNANPELSTLLATQALEEAPTDEADQALRRALSAPLQARLQTDGQMAGAFFTPGGERLLSTNRRPNGAWSLQLWDISANRLLREEPHAGRLGPIAFSADQRRLLTTSIEGTVRLWDVASLDRLNDDQPTRLNGQVIAATLRADDSWLLVAQGPGSDRPLLAFDSRDGNGWQPLRCQGQSPARVSRVIIGADGARVVALGRTTAWLWQTADWRCQGSLTFGTADSEISDAVFSHDGRSLVLAGGVQTGGDLRRGELGIWRTADLTLVASLPGHSAPVTEVAISPDDRWLISTGWDPTARLWELESGRLVATLHGHTSRVVGAGFSQPDRFAQPLALTIGLDQTVRLWEVPTGRPRAMLAGHDEAITSAIFEEAGRRVATASIDGTIRLWLIDSRPIAGAIRHSAAVRSASFSRDGQFVVTASQDGTAVVRQTATRREVILGPAPTVERAGCPAGVGDTSEGLTAAHFVATPPNAAQRIVTFGDRSCLARIWDVGSRQPLMVLRHDGRITDLTVAPDGQRIVTTSVDGQTRIWRASDGALERGLPKQPSACATPQADGSVRSAVFSPNGELIATMQTDCVAAVWRVTDGQMIGGPLIGHTGRVRTAAFSPDSRLLATVGQGAPHVWEIGTTSVTLKTILENAHRSPVESVAFSPDGRWLATAGSRPDNKAVLWDTRAWNPLDLIGHSDRVETVAFSANSRWVVTASEDTTARVWDTRTGLSLIELSEPVDRVWAAGFSPDSQLVATVSEDGLARLYRCGEVCGPLDELLALAHRRVARTLSCEERQRYLRDVVDCSRVATRTPATP